MAWTETEAFDALQSTDLLRLGMQADERRRALHPENVVTYALVAPAGLSLEEASQQAQSHGTGAVMLNGIAGISNLLPDQLSVHMISLRTGTPSLEFHHLAVSTLLGESAPSLLNRLYDGGLRSLRIEVSERIPLSSHAEELEFLLQAAASLSVGVTIAYTIGRGELNVQRVEELRQIRQWQHATQAVQAVALRIHHAATPDARREEEATAVDYLKTLAVTRLYLDGITHLSAEWDVMGPKVLELALRFGADDAGTVPWSQDARQGPAHHGGEAELRRIIRDAGFRPVERDALFRQSLLR